VSGDVSSTRPEPRKSLGIAVQRLRREAGLSQEELAARAELEPTLVAGIESGAVDPTWGDARRIAVALGTSVDRIAGLVEQLEEDG
jgi:transcriptional regulator with XRE-family HTH domain